MRVTNVGSRRPSPWSDVLQVLSDNVQYLCATLNVAAVNLFKFDFQLAVAPVVFRVQNQRLFRRARVGLCVCARQSQRHNLVVPPRILAVLLVQGLHVFARFEVERS